MDQEIADALELIAGRGGDKSRFGATTPTRHEVTLAKKQIILFLEALETDYNVSELLEQLTNG